MGDVASEMAARGGHIVVHKEPKDHLSKMSIEERVRKIVKNAKCRNVARDAPDAIENLTREWTEYEATWPNHEGDLINICDKELRAIPEEERCPMVRMYVQAKHIQFLSYSNHMFPSDPENYELFPHDERSVKRRKVESAMNALDKVRVQVGCDTYLAIANGVLTSRRAIE